MKFLCEQCKAKYQIADEKAAGKTVRMKCRKCGHLIEVRASVTETSASSVPESDRVGTPPPPAAGPPRPIPPRAKPPTPTPPPRDVVAKPEAPARTLAGAFKTAIHHDDEASPPVDMSDLSPSDEWYVAINGVPVGPIRVAEVRRKAALGAVSEDSLVWQEGLDEWRPLRTFPELATSVRQAMRRLSRPPAAEARSSAPPPSRVPGRSIPSGASPTRTVPPRAPPSSWPRSNVVPFMSRLATAERLDQPAPEPAGPVPG
ncbi:MAG: zinc-ribbon domain-containing protein, partial [Myxococcota bacterium]|nr:zinc-ribbon domain-containing protein [Myxococcota bacterium]